LRISDHPSGGARGLRIEIIPNPKSEIRNPKSKTQGQFAHFSYSPVLIAAVFSGCFCGRLAGSNGNE
jgi:hypothetical protein